MSYNYYPMPMPMPMPTPTTTPDHSYGIYTSPYHINIYPNPNPNVGVRMITYVSNQMHPSISNSTENRLNLYAAHHIANNAEILGSNLSLKIKGESMLISRATVNAFCTDFVKDDLAKCDLLTGPILERLEKEKKITIYHRETTAGDSTKYHLASDAPKVAISASIAAAIGEFSQFRHLIDSFFSYTYSKATNKCNTISTRYYANDEFTVTGCYLFRNVDKKHNKFRALLMHGKIMDTNYETQCYLFTFKVAQATEFIEKYLNK